MPLGVEQLGLGPMCLLTHTSDFVSGWWMFVGWLDVGIWTAAGTEAMSLLVPQFPTVNQHIPAGLRALPSAKKSPRWEQRKRLFCICITCISVCTHRRSFCFRRTIEVVWSFPKVVLSKPLKASCPLPAGKQPPAWDRARARRAAQVGWTAGLSPWHQSRTLLRSEQDEFPAQGFQQETPGEGECACHPEHDGGNGDSGL